MWINWPWNVKTCTERLLELCLFITGLLSHYHLTFTTEGIHNLLKSCLTFGNKTSPLFTLWSNHTREDKTKVEWQSERIKIQDIVLQTTLHSERNLGRVQKPFGQGRRGVEGRRGWLSEIVWGAKGLYFCLLFSAVVSKL